MTSPVDPASLREANTTSGDAESHGHAADLRWVRPPRQARTHQSLEQMLDVAEAMLRDKEFDDIHVSEIATRADTSVAGFYRRFKDKDGLLHALHERRCEEAFATADDALCPDRWSSATIAEILFAVFPFLVEILHSHENLDRAIYQRAITDEQMRERSMKLSRHVLDGLCDLMIERRDEINHPDPESAIPFSVIQAMALVVQLYTAGMRDIFPTPQSDAKVAHELATSCLTYLGIQHPYAPFGGDPS